MLVNSNTLSLRFVHAGVLPQEQMPVLFAGAVKHRAWEASSSTCTLLIWENACSRERHIGAAAAVLYCLRRGTKIARQAQRSR